MKKPPHYWLFLLLLLTLSLRLINLSGRPLWYDEAFSLLYAELSPAEMLAGTLGEAGAAADIHPLLYYLTLHGWLGLWGNSPAAARALSALLGTATVGLVYLLARELDGERWALVPALLTALSPFHIYYSQEARMYALLAFAAVATILFFVRAWKYGGINWLGFSLCGALLLYSHNLGALFLLALGFWVLYSWWRGPRWQHWQSLGLSLILMVLLFSPWLIVLPRQLAKVSAGYWVQAPGLAALVQTLLIFHFAYDNQALPSWLLPGALFLSLFLPGILALQLARQPHAARRDGFPYSLALLLLLSLGVVVLAFAISQIRPVFVVRALLPAALFYYLLIADGLQRAPRAVRLALGVAALLVTVAALWNHYTYALFPRAPFGAATVYLAEAGGQVIHSNKLTFLPAYYEAPQLPQQFVADPPDSASDTLHPATQEVLGIAEAESLDSALPPSGVVWLVLFKEALAEFEGTGQEHPHLIELEARFGAPEKEVQFEDLLLYRFR